MRPYVLYTAAENLSLATLLRVSVSQEEKTPAVQAIWQFQQSLAQDGVASAHLRKDPTRGDISDVAHLSGLPENGGLDNTVDITLSEPGLALG